MQTWHFIKTTVFDYLIVAFLACTQLNLASAIEIKTTGEQPKEALDDCRDVVDSDYSKKLPPGTTKGLKKPTAQSVGSNQKSK